MRQPGQEEIGGERIKAVKGRQVDSSPQELLAEHAADRRSALMGRRRQAFDGRLPDRLQIAVHPLQRRRPWLFNEERSEEHTSELQSLMRISYAVFCLKKKKRINITLELTNKA